MSIVGVIVLILVIYLSLVDKFYTLDTVKAKAEPMYFRADAKPTYFFRDSHRPTPVNDSIILTTNVRSGSTFVGELLNNDPDSFYAYEPLMFISEEYAIPSGKTEECKNNTVHVQALVDLMVNCRVDWIKKCYDVRENWAKYAFEMQNATLDEVYEK